MRVCVCVCVHVCYCASVCGSSVEYFIIAALPTVDDWSRGDSRLLTTDSHKTVPPCQLTVTKLYPVSADGHKTVPRVS